LEEQRIVKPIERRRRLWPTPSFLVKREEVLSGVWEDV
jgi:hypothetical protein